MAQQVEKFSGALAGLASLASVLYAVFFAIGTSQTCTTQRQCSVTSTSFWQQTPAVAVAALIGGVVAAAVLAGIPYIHSQHGRGPWLFVMWTLALMLTALTVIGALSFGVFLAVPALFSLAAATAGSIAQARTSPASSRNPRAV